MVPDGQQIAFRCQRVGEVQRGGGWRGVALVYLARRNKEVGLSQHCGGGSAGRGGNGVESQDSMIAAVGHIERVADAEDFIRTVKFVCRTSRRTGHHVRPADYVGGCGIGGGGNGVEHQYSIVPLFDHE